MPPMIMIVDDDEQVLTLVELLLRRQGYQVMKALSAAAALELLNTSQPDLFILDYMMPGMNGIELCEQLRSDPVWGKAHILMLSAVDTDDYVHQCMVAGADSCIAKSEMHRRLLSEVQQRLSIPQTK